MFSHLQIRLNATTRASLFFLRCAALLNILASNKSTKTVQLAAQIYASTSAGSKHLVCWKRARMAGAPHAHGPAELSFDSHKVTGYYPSKDPLPVTFRNALPGKTRPTDRSRRLTRGVGDPLSCTTGALIWPLMFFKAVAPPEGARLDTMSSRAESLASSSSVSVTPSHQNMLFCRRNHQLKLLRLLNRFKMPL